MSISFRTNSDGSNGAIQLNGTDRIVMTSSGNVTFKNSGTTTFEGTVSWPASPAFTGTPTAPTAAAGTNTTQIATTAFAKAEAASAVPVGSVQYFALSSAPAGWLKANGALVSRTTYANLFAAIGTVFGAGDGSTTFALPDLRGEFIRGVDDGRGIDTGRALGSAQGSQMQSHNHTLPGNIVERSTSSSLVWAVAGGSSAGPITSSMGLAGGTENGSENRPRNVALLACIRY